ncbi:hypothetical protein [Pseudoalteromonas fuliginea]|uniref:hypothetical protein n=1 Tax=Pseudoalteromonas fuliginea TaxID=1872678 RepID=UPI00316E2194
MRLFIVFLLLAFNAHAELIKNKNHGTLTVETFTSIYGGDTFYANIAGYII